MSAALVLSGRRRLVELAGEAFSGSFTAHKRELHSIADCVTIVMSSFRSVTKVNQSKVLVIYHVPKLTNQKPTTVLRSYHLIG